MIFLDMEKNTMYNKSRYMKNRHFEVKMEYFWLVFGFVLLIVGADIFVEGSSSLAKSFKIPTIIIGLTVVAFGTSMPEASVSISAALEGKNDIAVSNVIGSNIFNIAFVLGASAAISPMTVNIVSVYDIIILLFVSALSLYFARTQRRFSRIEGIIMVGIYAVYCGYILVR